MSEGGGAAGAGDCVPDRIEALGRPSWGTRPPPWAPGYREEAEDMDHRAEAQPHGAQRLAMLAKIDILADLSEPEVSQIVDAAPARIYRAGELLYTPHRPVEVLFLLKRGRIRVFRVSPDGRALTTAIVSPGTMFGEMALLGQRMYDNYAEALDEAYTCVMDRADARRLLLSDPRIAARIVEILGRRLTGAAPVRSGVQQRPAPGRRGTVHPGRRPSRRHPRRDNPPHRNAQPGGGAGRHLQGNRHQGPG